MARDKLGLSFVIIIIIAGLSNLRAQEILQWRGIERSGSFESINLLDEWPEEGPKLILQVEDLPKSYSSVIKKGELLFTTGIADTSEILSAINMDGTILWNTIYGEAWTKTFPNARCTPTIEGETAFLISGNGHLASVNINTGGLNWSVDGLTKYEGQYGDWGYAESPLIVDDKMIFNPGGDKTTVVAVDKTTGETIWMSESLNDRSAYCSPIVVKRGSTNLIITVTANYVLCLNSEDGEIFWKYDYGSLESPGKVGEINPVTPLIKGNEIFVTSGYNHIGIMLSMSDDYKSVKLKWKTSDLDVHHGGVVHYDGHIYGANYTSIIKGNWLCLNWDTGELQYEAEWTSKGSIIESSGKLICYDERRGNVALVNANSSNFDLISSFRIKPGFGPHWSHPTIYDDLLLMRHGQFLMVYDIGKDQGE